jgi:hypothetical protein
MGVLMRGGAKEVERSRVGKEVCEVWMGRETWCLDR